ncbi:MAG: hypothetical protein ACKOFV_06325 [Candidatus Nanopelagicaceae bacterium]
MSKQNTPSGSDLNNIFAAEACSMEKITIMHQLRSLNIEYKIIHNRKLNEITIEIPTTIHGILRISANEKGIYKNRRFFRNIPPKEMRLPGGKVLKSEAKEMVHAEVEFESHGEHESATYLIDQPNFAEVIDTAIECLAQIDSIYLSTIPKTPKKRQPRGDNPDKDDK